MNPQDLIPNSRFAASSLLSSSSVLSRLQSPRQLSASHLVPQFLSSCVPHRQFLSSSPSLSVSHSLLTITLSLSLPSSIDLSSNFRVPYSPLTVPESELVFHRRSSVVVAYWVIASAAAPSGRRRCCLLVSVLGSWVLSSDSAGFALRHGCSSPPLWLCPGPRLLWLVFWLRVCLLCFVLFDIGNMNSETVSNLVTTGVGSEAAPVEVDEPSSKRLRPATSGVWNFFKKLGPDKDGVERAECKGCKKVFKAGGKRYGTSTIKRHLDSCTQIKHEDIGQTIAELQLKMDKDQEDITKGEGYSSGVGSNDAGLARQPAMRRGGLGFWDCLNRRGGAGLRRDGAGFPT
ncbi:hypothetical protein Ahy_B08g091644 [Arachis hypogaea]|uniref:BED-type domain-containing protein n=1 Tax=Arachis hypogaea TaxID=3818 RepID=A0A444Y2D3_ARAHY|nr:hypothetical protein Ahy_B08g091644 [Arachis hypogaea]